MKAKLLNQTVKLLHGAIDLVEAVSQKTTGMLHSQVAKLETGHAQPPASAVPDEAEPSLPPDGPPV